MENQWCNVYLDFFVGSALQSYFDPLPLISQPFFAFPIPI